MAFADDTPKIKPMNKGEMAPFSGVLFNSSAVAQTIAEKEYNAEQCRLRIEYLEQKEKWNSYFISKKFKVRI